MNHEKSIEKFISRSIKNGTDPIEEAPFKMILEKMTTDEIHLWWIVYSASLAFSDAHVGNRHWETRKIEKKLEVMVGSYNYLPKEKDKNGKYIVVREDLILHIKEHILGKIKSGIQERIDFRNRSLKAKFQYYLSVLSLLTLPVFMIIDFFPKNKYYIPTLIICSIIFFSYFFLFPITFFIIKQTIEIFRKKKN